VLVLLPLLDGITLVRLGSWLLLLSESLGVAIPILSRLLTLASSIASSSSLYASLSSS